MTTRLMGVYIDKHTASQDELRGHLADHIPYDEKSRKQIIVCAREMQVLFHAGNICIC